MKEKNKWDYFMKIAKMASKKIGETSFLVLISKNIEEISNEYKEKVIRFLMKNEKKQIMMVEKNIIKHW